MKTKLLIAFFLSLALSALADGPIIQVSPFMKQALEAQNSADAQTKLGFTGATTLTTISNTAITSLQKQLILITNSFAAISNQFTPFSPYAWQTNGWLFDWWKAQAAQPASGSTVASFSGQKGNILLGNNVTFDGTGIRGLPGLAFPTSASVLSNMTMLATAFTNSGTVAVLFSWTRPATTPGGQMILNTSASGNALNFQLTPIPVTPSGDIFLEDDWTGGGSGGGGNIEMDSSASDPVHVYLGTWTNGPTGPIFQDYIDGKLIYNYPAGAFYPAASTWPVQFIGGFYLGNNFSDIWPFNGEIGEVVLSTNYAPFPLASSVSKTLLSDYGLPTKVIELDSDSMGFGGNAGYGASLMDVIMAIMPGWQFENCSVPGANSTKICTNAIVMANDAKAAVNVKIMWFNLNNDGGGGVSYPASLALLNGITNRMIAWAQNVSSSGAIPLLVVPPSCLPVDTNDERSAFIFWATNCALQYFSGLIRLDLDPNIGPSNACNNATFFASSGSVAGIHLNNNGNAVAAQYFPPAINAAVAGTTNIGTGLSIAGPVNLNAALLNFPSGANPQMTLAGNANLWGYWSGVGDLFYGFGALQFSGGPNGSTSHLLAIGTQALQDEASGADDVSIGMFSQNSANGTSRNVSLGNFALESNTQGSFNTAIGHGALAFVNSATNMTAIGYQAGFTAGPGIGDVDIGYNSGTAVLFPNSNIEINCVGQALDSRVGRYGQPGIQTNNYFAGQVTATGYASTGGWTIFGTNLLFNFGPNGVTNLTGLNMGIVGLAGSGMWISNTVSGQTIKLGTWTLSGNAPAVFPLNANDALIGNGCSEFGDHNL